MDIKKFHRKFENFCKISTVSSKSVCWNCILRFVERDCQNLLDGDRLDRIVDFLLNILLKYDCTDKSIFYKIVEIYIRLHFHDCECEEYDNFEKSVIYTMKPFRSLRSDQKEVLRSIVNVETLPTCLLDFNFFLILAKYGIQIGRSIFNIENAKKLLEDFLSAAQEAEEVINHSPEEITEIAGNFLDDLKRTQGRIPYSTTQRGMRYICLMLKTLQFISLDSDDSNIKCLGIIYSTIPDPFVSQEDMTEFITSFRRILPFEPETLERIIQNYMSYFGSESPKLYTPRSLKHLCRISLRHILMKNLKLLPHSVRKLNIPRNLHEYVLCLEPENFFNLNLSI